MTFLVSVIIPTYNRRDYVCEAIDSVMAQTYTEFEIIVVDDGSTDGTGGLLQARYGDRIQYVWQENQGESAARNRGIELAQGAYIALLDSDDSWEPCKLQRQIAVLEAASEVGLVFCLATMIDQNGKSLPGLMGTVSSQLELTFARLCLGNFVTAGSSTAVMRRDVLNKIGKFDIQIQYGEDWDLWLRMILETKFVFIPEPLAKIRLHRGGQWRFPSAEKTTAVLEDHLYLLNRAFEHFPGSTAMRKALEAKALAREYAKAAWAYYAFEQLEEGRACLESALALDPQTWKDPTKIRQAIIDTALTLSQATPDDDAVAERYVTTVLGHLPQPLAFLSCKQSNLIAQAEVEIGYWHHAMGNSARARQHLWWGIKRQPRYLRNLGLLKILIGKRI